MKGNFGQVSGGPRRVGQMDMPICLWIKVPGVPACVVYASAHALMVYHGVVQPHRMRRQLMHYVGCVWARPCACASVCTATGTPRVTQAPPAASSSGEVRRTGHGARAYVPNRGTSESARLRQQASVPRGVKTYKVDFLIWVTAGGRPLFVFFFFFFGGGLRK